FAYVTNENDNTISAYTIDRGTGALTQVAGSPYATDTTPISVTVNPAGTFAYVANANGSSVSAFSIDQATGALTQISGSPFSVGNGNSPYGITVNPAGTVVYVANWQASISAFSIDP